MMDRQKLIRNKQLRVQLGSVKTKKMQFEIKLLELEDEMDKIRQNMGLQDVAIAKLEGELAELEDNGVENE